jgi:alpha-amylase
MPCLYYGTEQDFHGGNDPSNRERLWDSGFPPARYAPTAAISTFGWTRRLATARRTYRALTPRQHVGALDDAAHGRRADAGMMAYERVDGGNYALVVIHAKDATARDGHGARRQRDAPCRQPEGTELVNVLGAEPAMVTVGTNGATNVGLGPWGSAVFVPQSQVRR